MTVFIALTAALPPRAPVRAAAEFLPGGEAVVLAARGTCAARACPPSQGDKSHRG